MCAHWLLLIIRYFTDMVKRLDADAEKTCLEDRFLVFQVVWQLLQAVQSLIILIPVALAVGNFDSKLKVKVFRIAVGCFI